MSLPVRFLVCLFASGLIFPIAGAILRIALPVEQAALAGLVVWFAAAARIALVVHRQANR